MKQLLATCLAALVCCGPVHSQMHQTSISKDRLNIKGLYIGMPFSEAILKIESSLAGGLNSKTCETHDIAPSDDTYAMGDVLVSCEGNYTFFGESIAHFSAIFADRKLRFVGIGSFRSQSSSLDQLPAVFRAMANKFQVNPEVSVVARFQRFKVYDYLSTFKDMDGSTLESSGRVDIAPCGTLHQNVKIRLTPARFVESQRERIRNAEAAVVQASNEMAKIKAADL